ETGSTGFFGYIYNSSLEEQRSGLVGGWDPANLGTLKKPPLCYKTQKPVSEDKKAVSDAQKTSSTAREKGTDRKTGHRNTEKPPQAHQLTPTDQEQTTRTKPNPSQATGTTRITELLRELYRSLRFGRPTINQNALQEALQTAGERDTLVLWLYGLLRGYPPEALEHWKGLLTEARHSRDYPTLLWIAEVCLREGVSNKVMRALKLLRNKGVGT
ncbi:MAG: hypothetical protein ACP5P0_00510, partial [Hydrogenobacter sp.]